MGILYLVLGIALIIMGALLCLAAPIAGILAIVFGVVLIVLSRKSKKTKTVQQPVPQPVDRPAAPAPTPAPAAATRPVSPAPEKKAQKVEPENHYLTDVNESLILRTAELNDDYKCSKRELADLGYADESIYKYDTITVPAVLEDDAVMFQGEAIGRIKAGSLSHVKNLLADPRLDHADLVVFGGPHKYIAQDFDDKDREVYEITNYSDAPFKATLKIYMKPEQ